MQTFYVKVRKVMNMNIILCSRNYSNNSYYWHDSKLSIIRKVPKVRYSWRGSLTGLTISNSVFFSNSELEHLDVFDVAELHGRHCLLDNLVVVCPGLPQCGYSAGVRLGIILQLSRAALKEENVKTIIINFPFSSQPASQTFWWIL